MTLMAATRTEAETNMATELAEEVLACARYGDEEQLQALLRDAKDDSERDALVNYVQAETLNTPLHMASANGQVGCVKELLAHGARHVANSSGNTPLHWAVQNKHLKVVKLLLDGVPDIDVLAQNGFGRGCVTEAFQADDADILSALLEHKSATEERLAAGSGMDNAKIREELEEDDEERKESEATANSPKILQETVLEFGFDKSLPTLKARELALDWNKDVFGTTAEEDITGVSIWSASLLLSRWIIGNAELFRGKTVCELGAGCGVSGLASYMYTKASRVVLSDLFQHTIENLEYNVALNKKTITATTEPDQEKADTDEEERGCDQCGIMQRFSPENPEGKLMKCGGCKTVQYCSRQCQKKAWKEHKTKCKRIRAQQEEFAASKSRAIEVAAIDWAKPETWPKDDSDNEAKAKFDVLLGSDLVYHRDIVPVLVNVVDGLLSSSPDAKFIHVASQARDSLVEFKDALEARGFSCDIQIVPDSYKTNPLVGDDSVVELFDLHFNEMSDIYCLYTFTRKL